MIARASVACVASASVGPEAIAAGSSPGTSLINRVSTGAGAASAARRPPFTREMAAHRVDPGNACARSQHGAGQGLQGIEVHARDWPSMQAELPPDISAMTRSCGVRLCSAATICCAATRLC
jgi:hypothetical protein